MKTDSAAIEVATQSSPETQPGSVSVPPESGPGDTQRGARAAARAVWLAQLADEHFQLVWRTLRRFGLSSAEADDAAQQVFEVAARRLTESGAGRDKGFLLRSAVLIATAYRRRRASRRETGDLVDQLPDPEAGQDELCERKRYREALDRLLDAMPLKFRAVFVLFEIEGLSILEIARALDIPQGTVSSRLRRARGLFDKSVISLRAAQQRKGGMP